MTKDEYDDFRLRYKGCGACFPIYSELSRFEKMWFTAIQKDVAELERLNSNQSESLRVTMLEEEKKGRRIAELEAENKQIKDSDTLCKLIGEQKLKIAELKEQLETFRLKVEALSGDIPWSELKDKSDLIKENAELEEKLANADYQLEGRDLKIAELEQENAELKCHIGLTVECEKAQKNGKLCLGYGGDEDEPCEQCKNCIKCECGYYQLGETEKDMRIAELTEQNTSLLTSVENLNKTVQELEQENAELKEEYKYWLDMKDSKLTKAKEIIKKFIACENRTVDYEDIIEAENFLKESEVEK